MPRKKKVEQVEENKPEQKKRAKTEKPSIHGTGRRKTAIASVFMWEGKGEFTINDKPVEEYFKTEIERTTWLRPFHLVGISHPKAKYNGTIKVSGSGHSAQSGAVLHAVARALAKINEEFKQALAKAGMLTRDPRMVERKKPFLHKARKRPQYSKR